MPDVKISQLPAGTANANAVVPATNAAGTQTQKVTLGSIRDLPHNHAIADVTGLQAELDGKQASGSYAAASHTHTASQITDFTTAVQAAAPATTNASLLTSGTLADARLSANVVLTGDARLSDARVPTDGSVTDAKIATAGLSALSINWVAVTPWAPNTAYAKGALVHYLGITYRRSVAGTTGATFNAANWQQMTAPVNVTTTPAQITSNRNDYALDIATADIFRISSDAARNITGITAGLFDGHAILLRNVGSFAITLRHQDAASAAANRIISPWAGDVVISANSSMLLMYDSTLSRWVVT